MRKGVPTPNAFECETGNEESYHFKNAGWFSWDNPQAMENSPYKDKVKKNIVKLGLDYKYKNSAFDNLKK